jgi:Zn-dependent peptidase ImmA (M78 family)/transcriptional regulator with XRE-family HTH domain
MSMQNNKETRSLIPERIREAREARGYTLEAFADALGVSKQAVAQFETGITAPAPDNIAAIIRLTEQPPSFFTVDRTRSAERYRMPFWRSLKRMERPHRLRVARRLEWARDIVDYVEQFIELPQVNLPQIDFDPDKATDEDVERAAERLRDAWGLGRGPITALSRVLEANGVILICESVDCEDMDAVSRWQVGRPFILYSAEVESGPRCVFNLAHELGHILLHSSVEVDSKNLDSIETQANRFAGAFLLPRETFAREVVSTSIRYFTYLKERWGVAIAAMVYRCKDLQILSKNQHGYLMRQMHAQSIRNREPLDDKFHPPRPMVLNEALQMLIKHSVQTKAEIDGALSLNTKDVESICGAEAGFLDSRVVPFAIRRKD